MNQESIIWSIHQFTQNWTIEDWRSFRDKNYWETKDRFHRAWFNKKTKKWDNKVYYRWLKWKLEYLMDYLD